ncbi:quaternary amine ABC transporter ATP-binding protein [Streptomyces cavernicola]|uniref:Betaine/proline/choline family ABC transporter ATP-binding protein n=1 Tax=Streptomyces cavernicola TaxID=3043613 RepID=A0ABT6SDY1_9ACTN|nr:betaine/proline/choline family ABC transporter ATP-binding protein [Streptomyces sp. B-S-A6]MDI3406407.1 betaine/proline/choline family ABC transporter ATP-binding protein [Streptomyces sp. B-S-A6]
MIKANRLEKVFGSPTDGVRAVDDVTFDVATGELFVIMGLSGSGKSTLLRMLNRLVEPTSGELHVDGRDVLSMAEPDLRELRNRKINMIFQHFALFPHRTVRENAAYGMRVRGISQTERMERADWALRTVGLGHRGDAYPHELSGGMRQRVGLARALATDAEVLLMDEPFSALDPLIRRDMQDLLLTLQRDLRRTIVFVTHDLNEAMRLGDRIMVMRDGRVVQLGTVPEILRSPADDYVSDFVSDVDRSRVLTASIVMREPLVTAHTEDDPQDVLRRLSNIEAGGAYVLDFRGRVVGVARDDLLAQAAGAGQSNLLECMADGFDRAGPDTLLVELCDRVGQHSVPLAVTDDDGKLLGVVPRAALLSALADPRKAAHV